jgi:phosphatidate cytidylyltransferase
MPIQYRNLYLRFLTALVGVPLIVGLIYWNAWTYFFLFLFILVGTLVEYYGLIYNAGVRPLTYWGVACGLWLYTSSFLYAKGCMGSVYGWTNLLVIFVSYWMVLYRKNDPVPFHTLAHTLLGIFYVAFPFVCLHQIAFQHTIYNGRGVLGIFIMLWTNDIGAYFIGSWLGRHKLFERISPKKTWEGTIGGIFFTVLISQLLARYFTTYSPLTWLMMGCIIAVVGTYGDLLESLLKRSLQIKDSGELLPGHGGFLDRFDSFLLAIPILLAFLEVYAYIYF